MKTRSAKAKGRKLQNDLAARILFLYPELTNADVRPALMSEQGMDIKLSTAARKLIPFAFESKNQEKIQIWAAIAQAEENAKKEGLTPAVVFSRNRTPEPYVALPLMDLLHLIKEAFQCRTLIP